MWFTDWNRVGAERHTFILTALGDPFEAFVYGFVGLLFVAKMRFKLAAYTFGVIVADALSNAWSVDQQVIRASHGEAAYAGLLAVNLGLSLLFILTIGALLAMTFLPKYRASASPRTASTADRKARPATKSPHRQPEVISDPR